MENFSLSRDARQVLTVTLTRPDLHNAFDDETIATLTVALKEVNEDRSVRAIVLTGAGRSFSAGADLNWMRRIADYSEEENYHDAMALAELMLTLNTLSKPTIARVNGSAFGGGVGLVACCDIAIASEEAQFALSEVRLGLIPAVISPYVIATIGARMSRRYFLTGERFSAAQAQRMGLLHEVVSADRLDAAVREMTDSLLGSGPIALHEAKDLIASVSSRPATDSVIADTAERIARVRVSAEGKEGLAAFFAKRKPAWATQA